MNCELCNEKGYIWINSNLNREILIGKKCHEAIQKHDILRTIQVKKGIDYPSQQRVFAHLQNNKIRIIPNDNEVLFV